MAQNRYLPFGYLIANGAIAVQPQEAETVHLIYRQYAEGVSYKSIAAALTGAGIPYMPDKPEWNKNMVARILQNSHYLGDEKYPAIIKPEEGAAAQNAQKQYTHTESREVKQLKELLVCAVCGEPVKRRIKSQGEERWYCSSGPHHIGTAVTDAVLLKNAQDQLNQLISSPVSITRGTSRPDKLSFKVARLQNELELTMRQEPPDGDQAKNLIFQLAAEKYALCDDDEETENTILRLLSGAEPQPEPDTALMCKIAQKIAVGRQGEVTLILRNGKNTEDGGTRHE